MVTTSTYVNTVLGKITAEDLGVCYPHEHLLGYPPEPYFDDDLSLDNIDAAVNEMDFFKQAGGQSLVDMTTEDYNRDATGLKRISEATGVHIIAATGHHKNKFSEPYVENSTVEELAEKFMREISRGIGDSGIKAGVIKAGTMKNRVSDNAKKVLTAAAIAHQETGIPVSTHTEAGTMALEQIEILTESGADPEKIIIGHLDRKLEWDYHQQIADTGVTLGFDQVGKEKYYPDRKRIEFIKKLIDTGYENQIILSGDLARKSYWPSYNTGGGPGFTYILWRFLPWLREEGVTENSIQTIIRRTPARIFASNG
jgi:phosphotriesterase-related protein